MHLKLTTYWFPGLMMMRYEHDEICKVVSQMRIIKNMVMKYGDDDDDDDSDVDDDNDDLLWN